MSHRRGRVPRRVVRVFLDTNVLVSAFASRGLCADLVRHVLAEHELIVGEVVLAELRRVLRDRIRLPRATIAEIEALLRDQIVVPRPSQPAAVQIRDPSDRWTLASAIAGHAEVLVRRRPARATRACAAFDHVAEAVLGDGSPTGGVAMVDAYFGPDFAAARR